MGDDTPVVAMAKMDHLTYVRMTEEGGLVGLQASQIPNMYIDDVEQVKEAKAVFRAAFEKAVVMDEAASAEPEPLAEPAAAVAAPLVYQQPMVYQQPLGLPYHYGVLPHLPLQTTNAVQ